jgi:hypothetical protein
VSRAGLPSAKLRPVKGTQGNQQRIVNEMRRRCVCGSERTIRQDGVFVEIYCPKCARVALRVRFRSAQAVREIFAQLRARQKNQLPS